MFGQGRKFYLSRARNSTGNEVGLKFVEIGISVFDGTCQFLADFCFDHLIQGFPTEIRSNQKIRHSFSEKAVKECVGGKPKNNGQDYSQFWDFDSFCIFRVLQLFSYIMRTKVIRKLLTLNMKSFRI